MSVSVEDPPGADKRPEGDAAATATRGAHRAPEEIEDPSLGAEPDSTVKTEEKDVPIEDVKPSEDPAEMTELENELLSTKDRKKDAKKKPSKREQKGNDRLAKLRADLRKAEEHLGEIPEVEPENSLREKRKRKKAIILAIEDVEDAAKRLAKFEAVDDRPLIVVLASAIVWTLITVICLGVVAGAVGNRLGYYQVDTVLSGSMEPEFYPGDVVISVGQDRNYLAPGQIIVFYPPRLDTKVTHRVMTVERNDDGDIVVTTKGDNNNAADPWQAIVSSENVWVVKGTIPYIGWVANWSLRWWPALLGLLFAILFTSFARDRICESMGWRDKPTRQKARRARRWNKRENAKAEKNPDYVVNLRSIPPKPRRGGKLRGLSFLYLLAPALLFVGGFYYAADRNGTWNPFGTSSVVEQNTTFDDWTPPEPDQTAPAPTDAGTSPDGSVTDPSTANPDTSGQVEVPAEGAP